MDSLTTEKGPVRMFTKAATFNRTVAATLACLAPISSIRSMLSFWRLFLLSVCSCGSSGSVTMPLASVTVSYVSAPSATVATSSL